MSYVGGYVIADFTGVEFASSANTGVANNVPQQVMDALTQTEKPVMIKNIKITIAEAETAMTGFATRIDMAGLPTFEISAGRAISVTGANQITANF